VTSNRPSRQRARPLPKGNARPLPKGNVRPLPNGDSLYTPGASPARQVTERRSARPLMFLHQLPGWIAPLALLVLLIAGLAVRGPGGAVALCGVAAVLGWLAALSWPRLSAGGRMGRILAVALIVGLAAFQATR
jgi:hypothetical protein